MTLKQALDKVLSDGVASVAMPSAVAAVASRVDNQSLPPYHAFEKATCDNLH